MMEFWTSLASLLGVLAFCQSLLQVVFPPELYLSSFVSASASATTFGLSNNDCINDVFDGAAVQWVHVVTQCQSQSFSGRPPPPDEKRGFKLRIRKRDKDLILDYIMDKAIDILRKNQERFLYNNSRGGLLDSRGHPWESVPFKHPSTFDMLAMDPERKRDIMEDLCDFAAGQAFYQRTGQAWKRGYLLYGPLGMRKLSPVMANFLGYDIYDLELTQVHSKSELLNLLVTTSSKSIIVIKDIDCLINLSNPSKVPQAAAPQSYNYPGAPDAMCGGEDRNNTTITFLGLLNFPDGLRSCCGDERIFIFTTNHIEKLDPELLQSSRMDVHICMS